MTLARALRLLIPFLLVTAAVVVYAEGPLYVGGPPQYAPGIPFRWNPQNFPLTYWTDKGNVGTLSKAQADQLVSDAFSLWQSVPTTSISFSKAGDLSTDITEFNISTMQDQLNNCSLSLGPGTLARDRSIIYDTDGTIVDALLGPGNSDTTLGFADALCFSSDGSTFNHFNRGYAVLNGKPLSTGSGTTTDLKAVMTHEFGHLLGLDHSQINLDCLTSLCSAAEQAGVPLMFPFLMTPPQTTPRTDDQAGLAVLYPATTFATSKGQITGHVFFSDGVTPAEAYNVIARKVGNPQTIAVSNVSGALFTSDAGNPFVQSATLGTPSPFGSRDQSLIGSYSLPGLPPGTYTVEVEALNGSGTFAFVFGSGVGPIGSDLGFQFPLPSLLPTPPPCAQDYLVSGATATCNSTGASEITVSGGQVVSTGTDIILIGTPPGSDAWED